MSGAEGHVMSSRRTSKVDVDPVTVELIRNVIVGAVDELEENIVLAAHGVAIYAIRDMAAAWLDADLRTIAQGRLGPPIFQADFARPIQDGYDLFGREGIEKGDVILTNHPGTCGQHLNHVLVYSPIVLGSDLIGFTACRTHWSDVGGANEGSMTTYSRDIFGEGVQFRTLKVMKRGILDEEILRVVRHNTRLPDMCIGDLNAQIAACRLGEQRFLGLVEKYGKDVLFASIERIWEQSEEAARAVVSEIPDGSYEAETFLDDDGVNFGKPVRIKTTITVKGTDMEVDLSEIEPQTEGPINSRQGASAARIAFKYMTTPRLPTDEGCFRALQVHVREGTIAYSDESASMSFWTLPLPSIISTIMRALSDVIPDRVAAAHGWMVPWATWGPRGTQRYYHINSALPGWGASARGDGIHGVRPNIYGTTQDIPAEMEERVAPLRVKAHRLRADSGGAGSHRGGLGTEREYELLNDTHIMVWTDGVRFPARGIAGGLDGGPSGAFVEIPGAGQRDLAKVSGMALPKGSILRVWAGGGGGYGHPLERALESVLHDVIEGLVTVEGASSDYGVAIDKRNGHYEINEATTQKLRGVV
jgi:N-methylhydantoinase B